MEKSKNRQLREVARDHDVTNATTRRIRTAAIDILRNESLSVNEKLESIRELLEIEEELLASLAAQDEVLDQVGAELVGPTMEHYAKKVRGNRETMDMKEYARRVCR